MISGSSRSSRRRSRSFSSGLSSESGGGKWLATRAEYPGAPRQSTTQRRAAFGCRLFGERAERRYSGGVVCSKVLATAFVGAAIWGCQSKEPTPNAVASSNQPNAPPSASSALALPIPSASVAEETPRGDAAPAPVGGNWLKCYANFTP